MEQNALARLEGRNFEFYMIKRRITIGRNSRNASVDVNMGSSRFISRRHVEILMDSSRFWLLCRGKNGIFVDGIFQRREARRILLPASCIIRFPSTQIKLVFSSLLDEMGEGQIPQPSSPMGPPSAFQSPFVTPVPSPTGTISVINSCPTSPGSLDSKSHLPSFDIMAQYASKLLSVKHNDAIVLSDSEMMPGGGQQQRTEEEEEEGLEIVQPPVETTNGGSPGNSEQVEEKAREEQGNQNNEEGSTVTNPDERIGKDGKKYTKPPYSYAQLIVQALLASKERRQTLSNIYQFIAEKYPFYRLEDKGWKNSIRHNLSLNQYFMKAPREKEGLGFGKGGYWCMHPEYEEKLTAQAHVKRKKKGIPVFPSAGLMSRSAPPSPTHHPFLPTELTLKDHEKTFMIPHTPSTSHHFTLSPFLPRLPPSAASHSVPASPNRLPHAGFNAAPLRFFPLNVRSSSTEALALESRYARPAIIHELLPEIDRRESFRRKRPRPSDGSDGGMEDVPEPSTLRMQKTPVLLSSAQHPPPHMQLHPCFSLPQPQMRFPFVGMPILAQPSAVPVLPPTVATHQFALSPETVWENEGCSSSSPEEGDREH